MLGVRTPLATLAAPGPCDPSQPSSSSRGLGWGARVNRPRKGSPGVLGVVGGGATECSKWYRAARTAARHELAGEARRKRNYIRSVFGFGQLREALESQTAF